MKDLHVRDGLQLWLDASRVNDSRKAAGESELANGDATAAWFDGAIEGRRVEQPEQNAQPKLVKIGDSWVLRFDGEDDHLRLAKTGQKLDAATVFVVVAPHANPGDFRGFFAANANERRDYQSGMTLDLGPGPTFKFDQLNVEGIGFGGAHDLLDSSHDFGTLHIVEAIVDPATKQIELAIDGKSEGKRPFNATALSFDEITVGARFCNNGRGPQHMFGPFRGDIAELLVYDRVLTNDETKSVREYLNVQIRETGGRLAEGTQAVDIRRCGTGESRKPASDSDAATRVFSA